MSLFIWDQCLIEDAIAFFEYLEEWMLDEKSFSNHPDFQTLISANKIIVPELVAMQVMQHIQQDSNNYGYGITKFSVFKRAAILIDKIVKIQVFRAKEHVELTDQIKRCIKACNYRFAWDIAFFSLFQAKVDGSKGITKLLKEEIKFPSHHLMRDILEHDTNDMLTVPARALILESFAYMKHPEAVGIRDDDLDGCDPYFR